MSDFMKLCDKCKIAQLEHYSRQEGGTPPSLCSLCSLAFFGKVPRPSFSAHTTPSELIRFAATTQCPDGYRMTLKSQDEWTPLAHAWNQGIDAYLEAMVRSSADHRSGEVCIHPDELSTLLRRLSESGTDEAWLLRSSVLYTLGIEEI